MTSFYALLIGIALLSLAAVLMALRPPVSIRLVLVVILIAIVTSAASAVVARSRHAGTGVTVERGYPKPFFFQYRDENGLARPPGMSAIYFGVNTFVHLGFVAVAAAVVRRRPNTSSSTIPARMFVIRMILGVVFVILGIIGSLLPVLQGWVFFLLAFLVLFPKARMTEKVLTKAEPKMPRLVGWLRRMGIGTSERPRQDAVPE